jgi:hypothetical protein
VSRAKSASARTRSAWLVLGVAVVLGSTRTAHAADDDTHVCLTSYVETQKARRDGRLRAARAAADRCGRPICPDVIRNDCVRWQAELDQAIPTVVLSAVGPDGHDLTDVSILVDGVLFVARLDGRAVAMDPGAHVFRFVAPDGASVEQRVLLAEGERDRAVVGSFAPSADGRPVERPSPATRPVPASVWIVGGVGAAAATVAVTFWSLALFANPGLVSELSCKPNCPAGSSDTMSLRANIGDIAGAVSLLALGTAAYLYFTRSHVVHAAGPSLTPWGLTF